MSDKIQQLLSARNAELEKELAAKNRELEIETALESVRAIALSMKEPADMLEVCKVIAMELEKLGVTEIRNVQTAIFYVDKGTYMNYEYYSKHNKTVITETSYTNHKMHQAFANQMLKGKGEFFTTLISKAELPDWIAYQETTNVFIDSYIKTATSLNYYWHSLGPVALGISTYKPLIEDAMNLFRRFVNVFELAYRRYSDIEKAEAQAREAQIQLALERVRARTMAMQQSDELSEAVYVLFQQFKILGETPDQATIGIINEEEHVIEYWVTMYGNQMNRVFKFSIDEPHVTNRIYKAWKEKQKSLVIDLSGKDLLEFSRYRESMGGAKYNPKEKRRIINVGFFSKGLLNVQSTKARSVESVKLLERFAKVFEQTYTRFLDLQKAEAQAREAQIEAALERVRSRSMAMHKSDELKEAGELLWNELGKLNIQSLSSGYVLMDKEEKIGWTYAPNPATGKIAEPLGCLHTETKEMSEVLSRWKKQEPLSVIEMDEQETIAHQTFIADRALNLDGTICRWITAEQLIALSPKKLFLHNFNFKEGYLMIVGGVRLNEEQKELMRRFTKVFQQTYTRFLDLQKAEAQAREAQIEVSLERVRSKAMAMQKSEDLANAVAIVFEELDKLDLGMLRCGIGIINKENRSVNVWASTKSNKERPVQVSGDESMDTHPLLQGAFNAWLKQEEYSYVLEGKDLTDYYKAQVSANFKLPDSHSLVEGHEDVRQYYFVVTFPAGGLFAFRETAFPEEAKVMMKRFADVFNVTYTRFLDLQKAEAQARESQIQLALERVRARTMAMQRSDELSETASILFQQFVALGEHPIQITIGIIKEEARAMEFRVTNWSGGGSMVGVGFDVSIEEPTLISKIYEAWKKGNKSIVIDLSGEKLEGWLQYRNKVSGVQVKSSDTAGRRVTSVAFFSKGMICFSTPLPPPQESISILERFAGVFDLTYTRFLDLQKAEAQAREAQIELGLEKVRARAMAMQNSDELNDLVAILFEELTKLDLILARCIIWIVDNESQSARLWMANSEDKRSANSYFIKKIDHPYYNAIIKGWKERVPKWVHDLRGEEKRSIDKILLSDTELSKLPQAVKDGILNSEHTIVSGSFNNFGLIEASGPISLSEEQLEILNRFAKVFDLTYTRFNDLKQAEANEKEAVKQAALDRVRAEIASMRTINDLDRITPLIWNELTVLRIPFVRCGVFIMDERQQLIHTFLSTPDGKAIAAFHLPYNTPGNFADMVSNWHQKKNYIDHWNEKDFISIADTLVQQGAITSREQYMNTLPHQGIHLHFVPFLQGMLYVGNTNSLRNEEIKLIQSIADAFSTAYARYEDFNKLEAAKQQVDKTLVDLKQAQQQLVQSEKMASLGELTAGIAHEIQNPLNFVNNFSEVSNELLDEMKIELANGNNEEAISIANDIIQNLEKINHHGKRADAIVKGMLQHSRSSNNVKEATDMNALVDEYLRLCYHGLRAKDKSFNAAIKTDFDNGIGKINIIPQDIGRVILNLLTNAFYTVTEKNKLNIVGYEPIVFVSTKKLYDKIEIRVADNGNGIPQKVLDKIFQPFFTTKPTGQGTGLGLSLSYDIIKAHGGEIKVETEQAEGSKFIFTLPLNK